MLALGLGPSERLNDGHDKVDLLEDSRASFGPPPSTELGGHWSRGRSRP
jgi:hypothetical protein